MRFEMHSFGGLMHPYLQLNNGLGVVNFSIPEELLFTTGELLPACKAEVSTRLTLLMNANFMGAAIRPVVDTAWKDVKMQYKTFPSMRAALYALATNATVDVLLVPYQLRKTLEKEHEKHKTGGTLHFYSKVLKKARIPCPDPITKEVHSSMFGV